VRAFTIKLAVAVALLAGLLNCGSDVSPCTICPKMEGTWSFNYTPGTPTGPCSATAFPVQQGSLDITRAGARIYSSASGIDLEGTIYDDLTFTLRGDDLAPKDGGLSRIEIRGDYVGSSSGGGTDGGTPTGDVLTGTYTQVIRPATSTGDCRNPADFRAAR
jgi:hypothetical protein